MSSPSSDSTSKTNNTNNQTANIPPQTLLDVTGCANAICTNGTPHARSNVANQAGSFYLSSHFLSAQKTISASVNQAMKSGVPYIKYYEQNNSSFPIWAVTETLTLGTLSKLYGNLADEKIKFLVADAFEISAYYLKSWLEYLTQARNICAHYNRLLNRILPIRPTKHKKNAQYNNGKLFPLFIVLVCIYGQSWPEKGMEIINTLQSFNDDFSNIDLKPLGFPPNWKEVLLRNMRGGRDVQPI